TVEVNVDVPRRERGERLAAVRGRHDARVHDVDTVGVLRINDDVGVIHGDGVEGVASLPVEAAVGGAEDAALAVGRLHGGVDDARIGRGEGQTNPAHITAGQAGGDLLPRAAGVLGAVQGALRAAVDHRPDVPAALVGGGQEDVGVAGVDGHISHARV